MTCTIAYKVCGTFNKSVLGVESAKTVIDHFDGEYAFLRMKAPAKIIMGNYCYRNLAAAYYALCVPEDQRKQFEYLDAKRARKLYKNLPHDDRIEDHLYEAVKSKYEQHPNERQRLLGTAPLEIIYDTSGSHDHVLGRCRCRDCRGKEYQNLYGKVLMRVRDELQRGIK